MEKYFYLKKQMIGPRQLKVVVRISERQIHRQSSRYLDINHGFPCLTQPFHVAHFYESKQEKLKIVSSFIEKELETNHKCLCVLGDLRIKELKQFLDEKGIDLEKRNDVGDIEIERIVNLYFDNGGLVDQICKYLMDETKKSIEKGYDGLGVSLENGERLPSHRICGRRERLNEDQKNPHLHSPNLLCQYNLDSYDPTFISKSIEEHQTIIYKNTTCENLCYNPDKDQNESEKDITNRLLLDQIHRNEKLEREIEQRNQKSSVINRVLQHNIRNQLNILIGVIESIKQNTDLRPLLKDEIEASERATKSLIDDADKARYIQDELSNTQIIDDSISSILMEAIGEVERNNTSIDFIFNIDSDSTVIVDETFKFAYIELLSNLIDSFEDNDNSLLINVESIKDNRISIKVNAQGITKTDIESISRGIETPLCHCEGFGLWLLKWSIEKSGGQLNFIDGQESTVIETILKTR